MREKFHGFIKEINCNLARDTYIPLNFDIHFYWKYNFTETYKSPITKKV